VKVSEASCPFCRHSLAADFANLAPRLAPARRLGRAATFAFGVVAMSQGGCTENERAPRQDAASVPADAEPDAAPEDAYDYDGGGLPIYSAAPTPDAGTASRG
jgi:hypothetical protein